MNDIATVVLDILIFAIPCLIAGIIMIFKSTK